MLHLVTAFAVLSAAAVKDLMDREIPNLLPLLIALSSFLSPDGPRWEGLVVALPLFIAAVATGGIGGGDIKLVAAMGLVLGFTRTLLGLVISLTLLILTHFIFTKLGKGNLARRHGAWPLVPFLFCGMLAGLFI